MAKKTWRLPYSLPVATTGTSSERLLTNFDHRHDYFVSSIVYPDFVLTISGLHIIELLF